MEINAFIIRHKEVDTDKSFFAELFLTSPDFDLQILRAICKDLRLSTSGQKSDLAHRIAQEVKYSYGAQRVIIEHMVHRNRDWLTFKLAKLQKLPVGLPPEELVVKGGSEAWYGPIRSRFDEDATWYIRPKYFKHWELLEGRDLPSKHLIRWLCFARVGSDVVSLHWRGFSYAETSSEIDGNSKLFKPWMVVPDIFEEFLKLADVETQSVNLHDLILHDMWDKYRNDPQYKWTDKRIRAESGGVSLNAHAGSVELSVDGIKKLANTIRRSVEEELRQSYHHDLKDPFHFDEVILRTLIREFGALSYEFTLSNTTGENIFRAHTYFGMKPGNASSDSFPHLHVFVTWSDAIKQLNFLLENIRASHLVLDEKRSSNESRFEQIQML